MVATNRYTSVIMSREHCLACFKLYNKCQAVMLLPQQHGSSRLCEVTGFRHISSHFRQLPQQCVELLCDWQWHYKVFLVVHGEVQ